MDTLHNYGFDQGRDADAREYLLHGHARWNNFHTLNASRPVLSLALPI